MTSEEIAEMVLQSLRELQTMSYTDIVAEVEARMRRNKALLNLVGSTTEELERAGLYIVDDFIEADHVVGEIK